MFRGAVIVLLSILCLGLTITAFAGWRVQSQLAGEVKSLTAQLQALANRPPAPPAAESQILQISGRAFVGDPQHPAPLAKLTLINVKDASNVRELVTDAEGAFHSGPLAGGDYALLAETTERLADGRSPWLVQTAPIAAYPGVGVPPQGVDLAHHFGRLDIETSRPLPKVTIANRYSIETRLLVRVLSPQDRKKAWSQAQPSPPAWPVYIARDLSRGDAAARGGFSSIVRPEMERQFMDVLSREELDAHLQGTLFDQVGRFGPGKVALSVAVIADVYPVPYEPPSIDRVDEGIRSKVYSSQSNWRSAQTAVLQSLGNVSVGPGRGATLDDDDDFRWLTKGLGNVWMRELRIRNSSVHPPQPYLISTSWLPLDLDRPVPIESGRVTRVRVAVPDDLEARVQALIDADDMRQLIEALLGDGRLASRFNVGYDDSGERTPASRPNSPFFRTASITVVGTEPLKEAASEKAHN